MKFETILLHGLFIACFALCTLIFAAMLTFQPSTASLAGADAVQPTLISVLLTPASHCELPADGVICPRRIG